MVLGVVIAVATRVVVEPNMLLVVDSNESTELSVRLVLSKGSCSRCGSVMYIEPICRCSCSTDSAEDVLGASGLGVCSLGGDEE